MFTTTTTTAHQRVAAKVQYPQGVCRDHEYGSEWPCKECGK